MTAVEGVERRVNKYLCKWLGIPPSFMSVGLYTRSGQVQLPLSSVPACDDVPTLLMKKSKEQVSLRDQDASGYTSVEQAESALKLKDIIGNPCVGRQGFKSTHFQQPFHIYFLLTNKPPQMGYEGGPIV